MGCCNLSPGVAKWTYLVCFGLTAIATWILRDYSAAGLHYIHHLSACKCAALAVFLHSLADSGQG